MKSLHRVVVVLLLIALLTGCTGGQPAAPVATEQVQPAAPTVDTAATQAAQQTSDAKAAADAEATKVAQQTAAAQATNDAIAQATAAVETKAALDKAATSTAKAEAKAQATANAQATLDALKAGFMETINMLFADGQIGSTEGDYYPLEDHSAEMAQINTPFVDFIDYEAEDFVISADLYWLSASENANWPTSGCGFVYGFKDNYNADLTFAGLDGYTHSIQFREKTGARLFAFKKWGDPDRPEGRAKFTLSVYDKHVAVYVNDKLANEFLNALYKGGRLGYNIYSGTNKGFGTRCEFTNVQLMIFK
jgi:hypothetical protein